MASLPAFFQHGGTTVLDELACELEESALEEEGDGNLPQSANDLDELVDEPLNELIDAEGVGAEDLETFGAETETFGDLKVESLPTFFITPKLEDLNLESTPSKTIPTTSFTATPMKCNPPPGMGSTMKPPPPPGMGNYSAMKSASNVSGGAPGLVPPSTPSAPPGFRGSTPLGGGGVGGPVTPQAPPMFSSPMRSLQEFASPVQARQFTMNPSTPSHSNGVAVVEIAGNPVPIAPTMLTPTHSLTSHKSTTENHHASPYPGHAREYYGRGEYMSASDVRFVATKVLQPLDNGDPYADDFYFLQFNLKKSLAAREEAARQGQSTPVPLSLPLPTWKDMKERLKSQMQTTREFFEKVARDWEEKEQVLGHRIRTDITRPKALLSIPNVQDLDFDNFDDEAAGLETEWKAPFSSRLWTTRQAVQKGYEALFTVQELQLLAASPHISANPAAMDEIRKEIEAAIGLLSESLGILPSRVTEWGGFSGNTEGETCNLDGRHVAAIMQTIIGRKLICRGLTLLSSPQRWALVPVLLARALMSPASPSQPEALHVERKLLHIVGDFIQYSYQSHMQGNVASLSGMSNDAGTRVFLANLRQCVKNVIITHMEKKKQLRETLLADKARAEVMHIIVQVGDNISLETDSQLAEEWAQTKDAFMSLLDD